MESMDNLLEGYILVYTAGLVVSIILFVVCREIVMWYWKINKITSLLEKQNELLEQLVKK